MRTPKATIILSCIVFIALGILTATIGPVLPNLAGNTLSTLEAVGVIFTALFLGAFLAQIGCGSLIDRFGPRPVLIGGLLLMATGMLGVTLSRSLPFMLASGLLAGLGHGAVDIGINLLVARVFQDRSVAAVNLVNFFFGVGAVTGPAIASFTINRWNTGIPVIWMGVGVVLATIPFLAIFLLSPVAQSDRTVKTQDKPFFHSPLLWIAGMILFLYVGSENSMGGWTAEYMQRTTPVAADQATLVVSGFWMTLTFGRLFAAYLGTRWTSDRLLAVSLSGTGIGGLILACSTGSLPLTILAVLIIGFFFGPIFPTTFSICASMFQGSSGKATGLIVALASLGGMFLPPLQGIILTRMGANPSVWLIAIYGFAMIIVNFVRVRMGKNSETAIDVVSE